MSAPRLLVSWSGGKDAAWMLHLLRQAGAEVVGLMTTLRADTGRVVMHDVPLTLLEAQAEAAGLPLLTVPLPWSCPNPAYEAATGAALAEARDRLGVTHVAFGDLFLEDIRRYREHLMAGVGLTPLFPLWGQPTGALARQMVAGGLRARVACVDTARLDAALAGREFDAAFLDALPPGVDPCGEGGEFHTFTWGGPMFTSPIEVSVGVRQERDGSAYADLVGARRSSSSSS